MFATFCIITLEGGNEMCFCLKMAAMIFEAFGTSISGLLGGASSQDLFGAG